MNIYIYIHKAFFGVNVSFDVNNEKAMINDDSMTWEKSALSCELERRVFFFPVISFLILVFTLNYVIIL